MSRDFSAFDRVSLPMGVIVDGAWVYANDALASLVGDTREQFLRRGIVELVAPEDAPRIRDRYERRRRGEPVPDSYECAVLRPDGERRTVEVWNRYENGVLWVQACDRTDRARRQEKLLGLARLGARVQAAQTPDAVRTVAGEGLRELGAALMRIAPDGDAVRVLDVLAPTALRPDYEAASGQKVLGMRGPWVPGLERAWRDGIAYIDDILIGVSRFVEPAHAAAATQIAARDRYERGIAFRVATDGTPCEMWLVMAPWLEPGDAPAFALFGAQVSAALDAARVIADLSRSNDELAALNRLATLSGTVAEIPVLFAHGSRELTRVLRCKAISVYLVDEARRDLVLAYQHGGTDDEVRAFGRLSPEGTNHGVVLCEGRTMVRHVDDYPEPLREHLARMNHNTLVLVPLRVRSQVLGVLDVVYAETRDVEPREIELIEAMASHFGAAVESTRLVEDLRKSYDDLSRAQRQLVERERLAALGELAAAVAHEVRNPLGVIFNSLGSLRRMLPGQGDVGMLLEIIGEESARLNHIVGDLLDFARPATPSLRSEPLDRVLEDAVIAALSDVSLPIRVVREIEDGLPSVPMDVRLMRQAILNVVMNAIQAMPSGGDLTIRARVDGANGGRCVSVEIGDTGEGISLDVQPRIFEPFFTTKATGSGLGLAVVKRIVDGHHGEVCVESESGEGTRVSIRLPLEAPR